MKSEHHDNKNVTSDFNEAWFQIERLNNEYVSANTYSKNGEFEKWQWVLDNIWRELATDALLHEEHKLMSEIINKSTEVLKARRTKNRAMFYNKLSEKEILLRKLQEKVGKGSKRSEKFEAMM